MGNAFDTVLKFSFFVTASFRRDPGGGVNISIEGDTGGMFIHYSNVTGEERVKPTKKVQMNPSGQLKLPADVNTGNASSSAASEVAPDSQGISEGHEGLVQIEDTESGKEDGDAERALLMHPEKFSHGKWLKGGRLGIGGFGITYLGLSRQNQDDKVALKFMYVMDQNNDIPYLKTGKDASKKDLELLKKECTDLQNLNAAKDGNEDLHKHIISCREACVLNAKDGCEVAKEQAQFIVMDFAGMNGHDWVEKYWSDKAVISDVLEQVAKGLAYLGKLNPPMIHHDIKWENIAVSQAPNGAWLAKLIDLGAVVPWNSSGIGYESVASTPGFAPPEWGPYCYNGPAHSFDVYGLGAMALFALCGVDLNDLNELTHFGKAELKSGRGRNQVNLLSTCRKNRNCCSQFAAMLNPIGAQRPPPLTISFHLNKSAMEADPAELQKHMAVFLTDFLEELDPLLKLKLSKWKDLGLDFQTLKAEPEKGLKELYAEFKSQPANIKKAFREVERDPFEEGYDGQKNLAKVFGFLARAIAKKEIVPDKKPDISNLISRSIVYVAKKQYMTKDPASGKAVADPTWGKRGMAVLRTSVFFLYWKSKVLEFQDKHATQFNDGKVRWLELFQDGADFRWFADLFNGQPDKGQKGQGYKIWSYAARRCIPAERPKKLFSLPSFFQSVSEQAHRYYDMLERLHFLFAAYMQTFVLMIQCHNEQRAYAIQDFANALTKTVQEQWDVLSGTSEMMKKNWPSSLRDARMALKDMRSAADRLHEVLFSPPTKHLVELDKLEWSNFNQYEGKRGVFKEWNENYTPLTERDEVRLERVKKTCSSKYAFHLAIKADDLGAYMQLETLAENFRHIVFDIANMVLKDEVDAEKAGAGEDAFSQLSDKSDASNRSNGRREEPNAAANKRRDANVGKALEVELGIAGTFLTTVGKKAPAEKKDAAEKEPSKKDAEKEPPPIGWKIPFFSAGNNKKFDYPSDNALNLKAALEKRIIGAQEGCGHRLREVRFNAAGRLNARSLALDADANPNNRVEAGEI